MKYKSKMLKQSFQVCCYMYFLDACGRHQGNSGWLMLVSKKHIGTWLWLREVYGDDLGAWQTRPDLDIYLRAALPCSRGEAMFPTYWKHVFVNMIRVWNIFSWNVLNADKSSSFDKSLFSEAAKSFRAKIAEWIV